MKRSLNNRFKGKRLVEGNENEITAHELLLKEEDDKIVVKGRGSSGNVEVLSGGNSDNNINIDYYAYGSNAGGEGVDEVHKLIPFTNLFDFNTKFNGTYEEYKGVFIPVDKSIQIKDGSDGVSIEVPSGATGIASSEYLTLLFLCKYQRGNCVSYMASLSSCCNGLMMDSNLLGTPFDTGMIYEASTNILYYYSNASKKEESPINLTINPELAESLKIYESNSLHGGSHYKFRINGGSSIVTPESIDDSINK